MRWALDVHSRACTDSAPAVSPEQVAKLVNEHHVYLTKDGRISVAGITRVRRGPLSSACFASC